MLRILFLPVTPALITLTLSTSALAINEPPTTAPDLRNAYASLTALPGVPDAVKVDFDDPQVLLRSVTVQPTGTPEGGSCRVRVWIDNLLAKVMIVEPPSNLVGIDQPPSTSPALTWHALLQRVGIQEPPSGIVFTPQDGLTISLESVAPKYKNAACSANVLVLGSVYSDALAGQVTPVSPAALRAAYVSLQAGPDAPDDYELSFTDDVLVRSFDVLPARTSQAGDCVVHARINELLARIQINEPPSAIAGITEPPSAIARLDGVTLAGINQPPTGIVFTPNDRLRVELRSELRSKEKDKDATCAADVLILGTEYSNGQ